MRRTIPFIGVVVFLLALAPPASGTSGTMTITSNTTLTEDHYGSIVVDADNVTLDCAGFRVIGPSSDPSVPDGIVVAYRSGVTIRNCTVQGFSRGILLDSAGATTVFANTLAGNADYAIFLLDADGNLIMGNQATGNLGSAYGSSDFDGNTFSHNSAVGNSGHGFDMTRSSNNMLEGNVVKGNGGIGFKVFDGTDYNVFTWNQVRGNGMAGFYMYGGYDGEYQLEPPVGNTFSNNQVIGNWDQGVFLGTESTENLVTRNLVLRNGDLGIGLVGALDNLVRKNVACRNGSWDGYQDGGGGNYWTANVFCTSDI